MARNLGESYEAFLGEFYRGMGLLTTSEEKRFPKEKEVLELESDEESEEQDTQAEDIKRGAVRGLIRMEVVTTEEVSERRSTKRQKVAESSEAA